MNQQITAVAAGINDLPSNIARSLANTTTSPLASSDSSDSDSKPRIIKLLPQLDRKKFLKVNHWTQEIYLARRKNVKSEEAEGSIDPDDPEPGSSEVKVSTTSCYMEDENGAQLPESQKAAARTKARTFWIKLFKAGKAPPSHGKLDIDIKDEYIALMEDSFPWLRYCENHWKSDQIWRNHYSDWLRKAIEAKEKAEKEKAAKEKAEKEKASAEGEIIDVDADNGNGQEEPSSWSQVDSKTSEPKRRQVDGEMSKPKRRRVEEDEHVPPRPKPTKITTERLRVGLLISLGYMFH